MIGREQQDRIRRLAGMIAELRRDRGWSQAELARRAGVGRSMINALESESVMPNEVVIDGMARAFGVEPARLDASSGPVRLCVDRMVPAHIAEQIRALLDRAG